ncbi:MAG: 30S ribosomal protein S20 [Candidatus Portnoybacteria bacterium]
MPITKSAKKSLKQSQAKRVFNLRKLRKMKGSIKETNELIRDKKKKEANEALSGAYKAIDKAAKRGLLKKNTANRRKSRLARSIKKMG